MLQKTPTSLVYLTAAELGITERERAGLIEVRDDLASGRVKHAQHAVSRGKLNPSAHRSFNMKVWAISADCGTVCCIGGDMQLRGYGTHSSFSHNLDVLFMPRGANIRSWRNLTPAQAVRAIDHFLSGAGAECWPMALQDIPATA